MRVMSIALVISVLLLSACGQKGPLYLPQDQGIEPTAAKTSSEPKAGSQATPEQ